MHKKRVRDSFYYYTTVRKGDKTSSVYLGKDLLEAKKKESKLHHSNLGIPQITGILFIIGLTLLTFMLVDSFTGFFSYNEINTTENVNETITSTNQIILKENINLNEKQMNMKTFLTLGRRISRKKQLVL